MSLRVLGVAGSMRGNSGSTRALRMILEEAGNRGAQPELLDLREADLPMFRPGKEKIVTKSLEAATESVNRAEAFVLASPDYHGTMSSPMKNFLDFYWWEFTGKLFAYVCASHEKGLTVMDNMRTAIRQCYGWSMPYGLSLNADADLSQAGEVVNESLGRRITMLARDLVVYGEIIRNQFAGDINGDETDTFIARLR